MIRPLALALAAAVVVPLLLHWLTRTRPKQRRWAAWRFLPPPEPAESRRRQLDEPGLLAVRAATVLALALAAAAPTCDKPLAADPAAADVSAPRIVVDLSASMGVGAAGERPLDRAAAKLDSWWARYGWTEGEVFGCRDGELVPIHDAERAPPRRFVAPLEAQWHWGGADLDACIAGGDPDRDLIVLADGAPRPELAAGYRSARWVGLGDPDAGNAGFGEVALTTRRQQVRITGRVQGAGPDARVRLHWATPERPGVETLVDGEGGFAIDLLKPRSLGRLHLQLVGDDAAPWDNVVPLWLPAGDRPEVRLRGAFAPYAEHRLRDLFYAAGERLNLIGAPGQAPAPGVRQVWVVHEPDRLEPAVQADMLAGVEAGGIAVVFGEASQSGGASAWVPGWLHPEQATARPGVRVGEGLRSRWPDLAEADWDAVRVRRVLPLAEPRAGTEVWLETGDGLPVLTRFTMGQGAVFTWNMPLEPQSTNLPYTAAWVPLWLAMFDILAADAGSAETIAAGVDADAGYHNVERIGSVLRGDAPGRWLGWLRGRDPRGLKVLRATRVPAAEALPAAPPQTTALGGGELSTASDEASAPVSTAAWWLAAAMLLWLGQGIWAERRRGLALWLLAALGAAVAPAPAAAQGDANTLTAWVPSESAPTPNAVEGVRWLAGTWRDRASPEVAPAVREFSWRATDPGDPWVWWLGCRSFDPAGDPVLGRRTEALVKRHGTLWVDVCGGPLELARAAERIGNWAAARGWGERWRKLDDDHVLWRTFYLLDGWQDPDGAREVWALEYDGGERILLVANLAGNFARDAVGGWVRPLGRRERETLVRQSLNLVLYITTYDYKNDSIHLPFILERRRRHR